MMKAHIEDKDVKSCHDIKAYPEPAIVLAPKWQLLDLRGFVATHLSVVYSQSTLHSLGDIDVTPTTFRRLLEFKQSGKPPVLTGLHSSTTRRPFKRMLFTSIIGQQREVEQLCMVLMEKKL